MIFRRTPRIPVRPTLDIFDEADQPRLAEASGDYPTPTTRPAQRLVVLTKPVPRPPWRQVDPTYCCEGCEMFTELLAKLREIGIDVDVEQLQRRVP